MKSHDMSAAQEYGGMQVKSYGISSEEEDANDIPTDELTNRGPFSSLQQRRWRRNRGSTLHDPWQEAHLHRERQRLKNLKKTVSVLGLLAGVTLGSWFVLRYFTPKSKRPQRVDIGFEGAGMYPSIIPADMEEDEFGDYFFEPADRATFDSLVGDQPSSPAPLRRAFSEPADIDAFMNKVYGPLPENVKASVAQAAARVGAGGLSGLFSSEFSSVAEGSQGGDSGNASS
ncbi:hypothetical protein BESB_036160 [Besnoitia besnoiti]|uniref:Transmembrane protein n=1 Tax=Besnoitia besnoiti TaxID=94643 RepID=A0A2A9MF60_BESBE|nr:hypothetical protein BESB_036160 [Besnoitia besnoiti]PFH37158.1 hypothetical protein BESB_036160 [Besnoitia besnoiti]